MAGDAARLPALNPRRERPRSPPLPRTPAVAEPPADGRHDDLHGDVGAGAASTARSTSARASPTSTAIRSCSMPSTRRCAAASTSTRRWPACRSCASAIAAKIEALYGHRYDPATRDHGHRRRDAGDPHRRSSRSSRPGDEVIVLDPCYDSYEPEHRARRRRRRCTCRCTPGTLRARLRRASPPRSTPRTRAIIVNSPHNPSGTVWSAGRHGSGWPTLLRPTDVVVISDEVYEHMVYDGEHQSVARFPELAARSVVVSSFGKTYHVTGWKVGYAAAPARADGRVPQGAPVQRVHRQHADAARPRRATWPTRRTTSTCRRSTAPSATASAPAWRRRGCAPCPARAPTSSASTTRPSATCREADFCRWLTTRDRRRRDSALGVLRRRLRPAASPASASPRRTRRSTWRSSACAAL